MVIHETAVIEEGVIIEPNVHIGAFSVIGTPAEVKGENCPPGRVIIRSGTVIREHVTIHSSRHEYDRTEIGENCYIQAHSHIGHDAKLGDNVTLACYACVGGHSIIDDYVNMGLHSVTHQHTVIRTGTMIGANAFVKGKLDGFSIYVGVPARRIKANEYLIKKLPSVYATYTDLEKTHPY